MARRSVRGSSRACVIVDMPFGTYQESPAQAFRNAARLYAETGCSAVKLEGGAVMAETIRFLAERGIPVLGHVGLQPQSVNALGGFQAQGRTEVDAARVIADAQAVAEAGAFAMVVEGTAEPAARRLTELVSVPTIGIGASSACDGQILVIDDILGTFDAFKPRFVKRYAELSGAISAAVSAYADDVRAALPRPQHVYGSAPAVPAENASRAKKPLAHLGRAATGVQPPGTKPLLIMQRWTMSPVRFDLGGEFRHLRAHRRRCGSSHCPASRGCRS